MRLSLAIGKAALERQLILVLQLSMVKQLPSNLKVNTFQIYYKQGTDRVLLLDTLDWAINLEMRQNYASRKFETVTSYGQQP